MLTERPLVTLEDCGSFLAVEPEVRGLADLLVIPTVRIEHDDAGRRVGWDWRHGDTIAPGVGRIAADLLTQLGYHVERAPRELPREVDNPAYDAAGRHQLLDLSWVARIRNSSRTVLRLDPGVTYASVIASLCRAYPHARIAVLVPTRERAGRMLRSLRTQMQSDARRVRGERSYDGDGAESEVIVGVSYDREDVHLVDIAVVVDAAALARKPDRASLFSAGFCNARMVGLIRSETDLPPAESDMVISWFGCDWLPVRPAGQRIRPTQVEWHRVRKLPAVERALQPADLKHRAIVHSRARNQQIVKLVRKASSLQRVAVVVQDLHQAAVLARMIPGSNVCYGDAASLDVLTGEDREVCRPTRLRTISELHRAIQIVPIYRGCVDIAADIIIRADGLPGGEPDLQFSLAGEVGRPWDAPVRPLHIIDIEDRHHPTLRKWSRQRRRDYADWGFGPLPKLCREVRAYQRRCLQRLLELEVSDVR